MDLNERLRYKVRKGRNYWPGVGSIRRRDLVAVEMDRLRDALAERIEGVEEMLPRARDFATLCPKAPLAFLKELEDVLDAVVCCWVGIEFADGTCRPHGDSESAIWIPEVRHREVE